MINNQCCIQQHTPMSCQIANSNARGEGEDELASGMDIAGLPSDILVEVTARIARRFTAPLDDIINLRRSCKVFHDATAAREVGRCTRSGGCTGGTRQGSSPCFRRCAANGNPEASYILGLEEFCNRRKACGLRHLRRAMERGHVVAAYMLGMIMLRDSHSLDSIEQVMEYLEGGSPLAAPRTRSKIATIRREAASVMRRLTMCRSKVLEPTTPCRGPRCGGMETPEAWDEGDDEGRRFCSRLC